MTDIEYLTTDDINHPTHRADAAELFMGFVAALSAFVAAVALSEFFPGKGKSK
jgi:hypothetical protein